MSYTNAQEKLTLGGRYVNLVRRAVDRRRQRFTQLLRGRGLEIGALQNPTSLPASSEVIYSDILTIDQLEKIYPGSKHPNIISDSESFPTVADDSFDFVVANHVIEHVSRPIRALAEWHRILRPGGLLLMAVPDKRFTFDAQRERTSLEHLVADFYSDLPADELNKCHLLEWACHVEHLVPGTRDYAHWISDQLERGYSVHNHVWVVQDLFETLTWMARHTHARFALEQWSNSSPLRGDFVLLLRVHKGSNKGKVSTTGFFLVRAFADLQHHVLQLSVTAIRLIGRMRRSFLGHHTNVR